MYNIKQAFQFLWHLFLELLTHKWFKAIVLTNITMIVIENKKIIAEYIENQYISSSAIIFALFWLRFLIPELIPKKSYIQKNYQRLSLFQIQSGKDVTVVQDASYVRGPWRTKIQWQFDSALRLNPVIGLAKFKLKDQFQGKVANPTITDISATTEVAKFVLVVPITDKSTMMTYKDPLDFFEELTVVADSRHWGNIYDKVLYYFSVTVKNHKYFGWLC